MAPSERQRNLLGILAVVAAFLGLLAVLVGPSIHAALFPSAPIEERIAEAAVRVRDRVVARLKGAPPAPKRMELRLDSKQLPYTISLAFAALAIIGGSSAYLRHEDPRYAYVACGVGTLTLAWHAVLIAAGAVVLCLILFVVAAWLEL